MNFFIRSIVHNIGNYLRYVKIFFLRKAGIVIGENCMISLRAKLDIRRGAIIIGNNVTLTYGCVILSHDRASAILHPECASDGVTVIEDDVFVGVNSVILRNIKLGRGCIVGAGSVVTSDVPPHTLVIGNPAKVIRTITK